MGLFRFRLDDPLHDLAQPGRIAHTELLDRLQGLDAQDLADMPDVYSTALQLHRQRPPAGLGARALDARLLEQSREKPTELGRAVVRLAIPVLRTELEPFASTPRDEQRRGRIEASVRRLAARHPMPALQAFGQMRVDAVRQLLVRPTQRARLAVVGDLGAYQGIAQHAPVLGQIVAYAQQAQLGNGHTRSEAGKQQGGIAGAVLGAADLGDSHRMFELVILNNDGLWHLSP